MKMIFAFVCGVFLGLLALYGIDREVARREHENGLEAVDCIFESNCRFYNRQASEFFRG